MCIVFWTLSQPGYKLILASNRDEYLDRSALPAHWNSFEPVDSNDISRSSNGVDKQHSVSRDTTSPQAESGDGRILCGRDIGSPAAGTWLGMTRDLRIGVITSVRQGFRRKVDNPPSRGLLLKSFLSRSPDDPTTVHDHLAAIVGEVEDYDGFNLLLFKLHPPPSPPSMDSPHLDIPMDSTSSANYAPPPPPSSPTPHGLSIADSSKRPKAWGKPEVGYLSNHPSQSLIDIVTPTRVPTPLTTSNGDSEGDENKRPKFGTKVGMCFGLSNSSISQPWPKVNAGESAMAKSLKQWTESGGDDDNLVERMMKILSQSVPLNSLANVRNCTCIHPVKIGKDPDTPLKPGSPGRWYATRVSTVILVKESGEVMFVERDIFREEEDGTAKEGKDERRFEFKAELKA